MLRAAVFASVGVAFFAHWLITDPSFEGSTSQSEWRYVLGFSATLLTLALALPLFGRMVGGDWVFRWSIAAAAGVILGSVANIFEDGLKIDWFFFVFVFATAVISLFLLALSLAVAGTRRRAHKLLGLIPGATLAGLILYVWAGGPIMLVTWLVAAATAVALPARMQQRG